MTASAATLQQHLPYWLKLEPAQRFGCIGGARRFLHNRPHRNCPRNYRNYRRHHCPHLLCPTGNTIGGAWSNNISNYNDFVNYQRIGRFGFRLGHRTLSRATLVPDLIDDTRSPRRGIVAQLQWRLPLAVDVRLRSGIDRRQYHYVHCRRADIRWKPELAFKRRGELRRCH